MTIFIPQYIFAGGPNPPVPSEYALNTYDPMPASALYNRTTQFKSLDMMNGWLNGDRVPVPPTLDRFKDESSTQVFRVAQNLNLDFKTHNAGTATSLFIPGATLDFNLKWGARVLIFYNAIISNAGNVDTTDPSVGWPVEVSLAKPQPGVSSVGSFKRLAFIRPSYNVTPSSVPGLLGAMGKESVCGTATLDLIAGWHKIGMYIYTQSRLVRVSCRQLTIVAFRRMGG